MKILVIPDIHEDLDFLRYIIAYEDKEKYDRVVMLGDWFGDTTCERAEIINSVWDENLWRELKGSLLLDGRLFSHAGVHSSWWPEDLPDTQARAVWLQDQWEKAFDRIYKEAEPAIFAAGKARGGLLDHGSPIWLDFDEEFEDDLEVPQIVGHTRCPKQNEKGKSYCIDMMQSAYAVVDSGNVELRIWPSSWLGEAMLEGVE